LKLKCDEPLSNVAFNFNVRRYNQDGKVDTTGDGGGDAFWGKKIFIPSDPNNNAEMQEMTVLELLELSCGLAPSGPLNALTAAAPTAAMYDQAVRASYGLAEPPGTADGG
jgi:hypothetical protein